MYVGREVGRYNEFWEGETITYCTICLYNGTSDGLINAGHSELNLASFCSRVSWDTQHDIQLYFIQIEDLYVCMCTHVFIPLSKSKVSSLVYIILHERRTWAIKINEEIVCYK